MMITRPEGLDVTLGHAAPVRLHQAGFSSRAIQELHEHMVGLDDDDAVTSFINALADRVVHRDAESVFDSRVVFVIGSSGTGKTTLATKIAAYFKEHGISDRMMLAAAAGPGISASEDIKSYARLLNMRAAQIGIGEVSIAIQETSNRMIIDVNATPEDAITAIREVMQRLGSGKVTVVQAIPGGSSATMIGHQCSLYRKLNPMIALTKLDECEAMPAELSALALDGSGVGLLTGTKLSSAELQLRRCRSWRSIYRKMPPASRQVSGSDDSSKTQGIQADMASSIVVASGKGGVGKTSLAVNLGLTLARQGRRTILLDADFGMANAHILIGANPQRFVMDAIQGDASMADVLCDAPHGMKFISGSGLLEMLNLDQTTRYQTIRMVDELRDQTEILIADVPAGASDSSISFVAAADRVVVVLVASDKLP